MVLDRQVRADSGRGGDGGSLVSFAFGHVEVLDASRHAVDHQAVSTWTRWPCPGCGERRLLDDVWQLRVRDHPAGINPREVVVCAPCAATALGPEALGLTGSSPDEDATTDSDQRVDGYQDAL